MPLALAAQALIAMFMIAIGIPSASAQPLRAIPALNARVVDETGTLSAAQRQSLEARLTAMEQQHGSQVVVLMVPSTAPEDIAAYANRVGNAWKIGRKNVATACWCSWPRTIGACASKWPRHWRAPFPTLPPRASSMTP